jgi:CTP synthase
VQYHPELKSTVENPQPLFVHFVAAAKKYSENRLVTKNPQLQDVVI